MTKKRFISKTMLLITMMVTGVTSVWSEEVTYTISSKNTLSKKGTAPTGSSATIVETFGTSKQMTSGNSQTLTLKDYDTYKITKLVLSMKSNKSSGAGKLSYSTDGGSSYTYIVGNSSSGVDFGNAAWNGEWSSSYTNISKDVDITCGSDDIIIKIEATANSLYCQSYTLTYESAITYTITPLSSNDSYGTVSLVGRKIIATPNDGCRVSLTNPYEVQSGNVSITQEGNVFTVETEANCTIQINFEEIPSHTANFYVNGSSYSTVNALEGESVAFPTTEPDAMGGKVFMGWTDTEINGVQNEAPELVSAYVMQTTDINFYAVYATFVQGDETLVTDILNNATTGVGSVNNYSDWSGKTATSNAIYAGQSAGSYSSIQLRSKDNNSGVISTTSGGNLRKVKVEWSGNNSDGRTLDIYGSNTAYSSPTDLYSTTKRGTKLGSIVYGTSTDELTIYDNYTYIGLRSKDGALYLISVSITWSNGTPDAYTDYCTTLTEPITIGSTGYATYSGSSALNFANSDVTAFTVKYENGSAKLTAVEQVPAGAGVVLRANQGEYNINLLASADELSNNDLQVSDGTKTGNGTYFCLASGNNGVGFYRVGDGVTIPAGKCYLEVPSSSRQFIGFDDNTTSIDNATEEAIVRNGYFDLQGRQVAQPTKGLYIVNGKKVIIK